MHYPLVGIIIVNWNQKELTDKCLQLMKKITYPAAKIVVVDNGSSDVMAQSISSTSSSWNQIGPSLSKIIS